MQILVKKLSPEAVIPKKAIENDAGFDIVAIDDGVVSPEGYIQYKTGISIQPPKGVHTEIWPRSNISKYDLVLANSVGLIDNGYRGELLVRFKPVLRFAFDSKTNTTYAVLPVPIEKYKKGDKIAQLVISQTIGADLVESNDLASSLRGEGGFGSTSNK